MTLSTMKLLLRYAIIFTATPSLLSRDNFVSTVEGFSLQSKPIRLHSTALGSGTENDDYMRWARQARFAEDGDVIVELPRPLGLVLNADEQGNVYVEKVAPKGNAARTGKVKEGDIVTMCSATFGDQMWSCRGVGLTRVLAAIRVRSGIVRLVFESPKQYKTKQSLTTKQIREREEAAARAQAKKDALLQELDSDEQTWKSKKKFFGLF